MAGPQIPKDFRRVIIAASVGNVIEWYDFYIFGSLAAVLSVKFFEQSHPVAALLSTIALFTAGFLIRPLGAFLFGWMGDRIGRKYTFLVTLSGMGLGTGAIGLIPTYEQIGLSAAAVSLRRGQGPAHCEPVSTLNSLLYNTEINREFSVLWRKRHKTSERLAPTFRA